MKNRNLSVVLLSVALSTVLLAGCSGGLLEQENGSRPDIIQETGAEQNMPIEITQEEKVTPEYEDNYAVGSEAAKQFAEKIKSTTADRDIETLAELTSFPVYVGLPDVGVVETKEDFLAIGAEKIFTDELVASVEAADIENLQPSMAGFSVSGKGNANINFGVVEGILAIKGINY